MAMNHGKTVIEVRLRELSQLFDSLDPSPFAERDLDPKAEEYIIDSYRELHPGTPCAIVVHLDQPAAGPGADIAGAIREHFTRQSQRQRRDLRQLLRRGWFSLGIGLAFLAAVSVVSEAVGPLLSQRPPVQILHQGLLIIGWVAMWRPLEIFLYDWWPIVGQRRLYDRLSRLEVQIVGSETVQT